MLEYAIFTCTDGNNIIREEHIADKNRAFARFHYWCNLLFNDNSFRVGMVKCLDSNLDVVEGKMELIIHEVQPTVEETTEE